MKADAAAALMLSLLFTGALNSSCLSPPGKPKLTSCRSPEKETFTCWWEPGSDGGLPTNHSLYYRMENSETIFECPDYHTAGVNSCFFSKNNTSLWVNYNITVVAANDMGSNVSDPVNVDVVYIVQPHMPENVTVVLKGEDNPFLVVQWEPPLQADTRSGWITLFYQLRIKLEKENEWEELFAGQQKQFNIFSLHSGEVYLVQVRCRPDHGFWSEWSPTASIKVSHYIHRETSTWIPTAVFLALIFFIFIWTLHTKGNSVKHFLFPPVPGPKIKGFDTQQLKSGTSEEMFSSVVVRGFPPVSDYEDQLVKYLEVYDNEDQELVHCRKDLLEGILKSKSSSDSDSGRGSCDSGSFLMEKCSNPSDDPVKDNDNSVGEDEIKDSCLSESVSVKTQTWLDMSSFPHDKTLCYHSILEVPKQRSVPKGHQEDFWKNPPGLDYSKPGESGFQCTQVDGDLNINEIAEREATVPSLKPTEYVEVRRVNKENTLIVKLITPEYSGPFHAEFKGHDYSRVSGVVSDSVLLLQKETASQNFTECQEEDTPTENCAQQLTVKPSVHQQEAPTEEGLRLTSNGYVETAALLASY